MKQLAAHIRKTIRELDGERVLLLTDPDKRLMRDYLITRINTLKDVLKWIEEIGAALPSDQHNS